MLVVEMTHGDELSGNMSLHLPELNPLCAKYHSTPPHVVPFHPGTSRSGFSSVVEQIGYDPGPPQPDEVDPDPDPVPDAEPPLPQGDVGDGVAGVSEMTYVELQMGLTFGPPPAQQLPALAMTQP